MTDAAMRHRARVGRVIAPKSGGHGTLDEPSVAGVPESEGTVGCPRQGDGFTILRLSGMSYTPTIGMGGTLLHAPIQTKWLFVRAGRYNPARGFVSRPIRRLT